MRHLIKTEIVIDRSPVEFIPASSEERAQCLALKAAAKSKSAKRTARKDRWISPELREETASRLVGFVIRRIQFPKRGEPFPLSATDKDDATQAGMIAIHEAGFFRHGFANLRVLRAIRNAIQGRNCLRLRCKAETLSDNITAIADEAGLMTAEEIISSHLRKSQVVVCREIMRTLRAARDCDNSRKAAASFRSQRDMLLLVIGHLTGRVPRNVSTHAFDMRKSRFLDYLAIGADQLRATRKPPNLAAEIMQALEIRAFA